jgi:DNA repair protein RecN (Recombination protein N)
MLAELAVQNLGVIEDLRLVLGPGMTALTGETGAGKTLVVEAIELLMGGRADSVLVRPGATEAVVEGRFVTDEDEEIVLRRVVPAEGRSRAYIDGRMATAASLAEVGAGLVDLHGQHTHQSLLGAPAQRRALDAFAGVDLEPLRKARAEVSDIDRRLAELGGDPGARARELDLLAFQIAEIDGAALHDPDEDHTLEAEEDALADALAHREAAAEALAAFSDDGAALDALGRAAEAMAGRAPFRDLHSRLQGVLAEVSDLATETRAVGEAIVDDPERLAAVRERRRLLHDLGRKYGTAVPGASGTLPDVLAYHRELVTRAAELSRHDDLAAELEAARATALEAVRAAEARVGRVRRKAAVPLAQQVQAELRELAMGRAELVVTVGADPGDEVRFLLSANPGAAPLPLAKVASGGELARVMLAIRLVLTAAPPTLVFDEVDAGIGGAAATAVGRALAGIAADHQVLVVTHLAQVAAQADHHVRVTKAQSDRFTVSDVAALDADERVVELSRMLSGEAQSAAAQEHVRELLAAAGKPARRSTRR